MTHTEREPQYKHTKPQSIRLCFTDFDPPSPWLLLSRVREMERYHQVNSSDAKCIRVRRVAAVDPFLTKEGCMQEIAYSGWVLPLASAYDAEKPALNTPMSVSQCHKQMHHSAIGTVIEYTF